MYAILRSVDGTHLCETLMLVDDRRDAEEIARELNRRGQSVIVREVLDNLARAAGPRPGAGVD
jgi:hypothetical protein